MKMLVLIFFFVILGCGGETESTASEDKESVFDPLTDNLEKAKEVEDKVMEQKRQLDEAIENAESSVGDIKEEAED